MRIPILPLAVTLLAVPALAQNVSITTLGAYGNFAIEGDAAALKFIPGATAITSAHSIESHQGGATAHTGLTPSDHGIAIVEHGACSRTGEGRSAAGTTNSTSSSNIVRGPHSLLLKLGGDHGARGRLLVGFVAAGDGGAKGRAVADIHNDQNVEFEATLPTSLVTKEFPIDSDKAVLVRVSTEALVELSGAGKAGYGMTLKLLFEPRSGDDACIATAFGTTCGSKVSVKDEVTGMMHKFTVTTTGGMPDGVGVLHLGLRPTELKIPGTECLIYTIPVIAIPQKLDAHGNATRTLFAHGPLVGVAFVQAASLIHAPLGKFETSHGVKVDCGAK